MTAIREFLRVIPGPKGCFQVISEPMHTARGSQLYHTRAEAEAFIDGYQACLDENEPLGEPEPCYVTGVFDEVEFMGQMPDAHGRYAYGPFDNLEVAKYHARTLSSDPDEAVVLPLRWPE